MTMRARMVVAVVVAVAVLAASGAVWAQDVGTIVKTLGIGVAVKMFAPQLNTFINNLLQAKDVQTNQTTNEPGHDRRGAGCGFEGGRREGPGRGVP
jgi:hypothetical protein